MKLGDANSITYLIIVVVLNTSSVTQFHQFVSYSLVDLIAISLLSLR